MDYLNEDIEILDFVKFIDILENNKSDISWKTTNMKKNQVFQIADLWNLHMFSNKISGVQTARNFFPIDVNDLEGFGIKIKI